MAFIVKKNIGGKDYYYLNENKRIDGKVKTKTLAYLGKTKKEAEKKAREFLKKMETETHEDDKQEKITASATSISVEDMAVFCKRRGFVYQSADIYGGFAGFWDFGHLGAELKNNIKKEWWKFHVWGRRDIKGIDGSIITHPLVWKASGHIDSFSDIFVLCRKCKKPEKIDRKDLGKVKCPKCGGEFDETSAKEFKLMFKTGVGEKDEAYLRPETAQLIFTNFKFVYENARMKLPFGIAQVGKAFRNEIAPRDFLFRCREFEQMEIEYFIFPDSSCIYEIPDVEIFVLSAEAQEKNEPPKKMWIRDALKKKIIKKDWHAYWLATEFSWFINLGAHPDNFRIRQHGKDELAHYSSDCWDLEYKFPFGWKELEGIADRSDYDLSQHQKFSKKDLTVFDEESKKKILPQVICEPSLGVERAFLVFMFDSYYYDKERENIVLKLHPKVAPIKAAIFPIVKKEEFEKICSDIFDDLKKEWNVIYDESGSIGRRYSRSDEQGIPMCITVDEQSLKDKTITLRDRDTTEQVRVKISELKEIMRKVINEECSILKFGKKVSTRVK